MKIQLKYFIAAVVVMGSIGVWLPIGIEYVVDKHFNYHSIPQNITTYFVSLLFAGSIDLFIKKLKRIQTHGIINEFLNLIFIFLGSSVVIIGSIILNVWRLDNWALFLAIIGTLGSYRIWWLANDDNPNFVNVNETLGGEPTRKLSSN